jgi:FAS-associated factor 2
MGQIAIAKFFDGEGPDLLAEARAAQATAAQASSGRNGTDRIDRINGRPSRTRRHEPAPRVVPQPSVVYHTPFIIAIFFAPLRIGYKIAAGLFRTFLYVLSFLPLAIRPRLITSTINKGLRQTHGRRMLLPKETAQRFRRDFEEEYGILLPPEHDDSETFVRNTLLAPEVVEFLKDPTNNLIIWGGNLLDTEAYQVSLEYRCNKFPVTCITCLTPMDGGTPMSIVKRLVGPMTPESYIAQIQRVMARYGPDLDGIRAQRAEMEATRRLLAEQDAAYERSVAIDREKKRQRLEAEAAAAAAEKRAREEAEAAALLAEQVRRWREWRAGTIRPEPGAEIKNAVRLALNLPPTTGIGRVVRRFHPDTTLEELYAFVDCYAVLQEREQQSDGVANGPATGEKPEGYEHKFTFEIYTVMPREKLVPSTTVTLAEKLGRGGNLAVEEIL